MNGIANLKEKNQCLGQIKWKKKMMLTSMNCLIPKLSESITESQKTKKSLILTFLNVSSLNT